MKSPKSTEDRPLMAKAVADAVGATKRQVQLWTDAGVLECLPGSGQRRGHQRLYPRTELPFAAIALALANHEQPIRRIAAATSIMRAEMSGRFGRSEYAKWCHEAWKGETDSYFVFGPAPDNNRAWIRPEGLGPWLHDRRGGFVLPVHTIVSPFVE